jgi:transcriptional regulator with XRE-family HTH domain
MRELGLTAVQLAQKAGLDPSTVRAVIAGRRWPNEATRQKLAEALGWKLGDVARLAMACHVTLEQVPTADLVRELCRRFDDPHVRDVPVRGTSRPPLKTVSA